MIERTGGLARLISREIRTRKADAKARKELEANPHVFQVYYSDPEKRIGFSLITRRIQRIWSI